MTGEALLAGDISETRIANMLKAARGDLFVAAGRLGITPLELDGYVKASDSLQVVVMALAEAKKDSGYHQYSREQFEQRVAELQAVYRYDGLEEVHKIATMAMPADNAMMMGVKLQAALALKGAPSQQGASSDVEGILAQLDRDYKALAPRIRRIRAVEIEIDTGLLE